MGAAEDEIFDVGTKMFMTWGLDMASSRLISVLLFTPGELSSQDLHRQTGYSLATIHNKLKMFESVGVVERISKPGTKKIYYFMEKDRLKLLTQKVEKVCTAEAAFCNDNMRPILAKYKNKKVSEKEKQMLTILDKFYSQSLKLGIYLKEFLKKMESL